MDELAAQQAELNRMKKEFDTALQEKQKVQEEAEYTRNRYEIL
jgi:Tfp pilus assembly protein PilN